MAYMMTKETARRWFRRLGPQFKADCLNLDLPNIDVARTHGVSKQTIMRIRQAMVPKYKPRMIDVSESKIWDALHADITQAEAAARVGVNQTTISRYRRLLGLKPRVPKPIRYDDSTMALLRSSLEDDHVARALGVEASTVRKHRYALRPPRRAYTPPDELEKMTPEILAARSTRAAAAMLGISYSAAAIIRARHKGKKKTLPDAFCTITDYATLTVQEIAAIVGMPEANVRYYLRTRGITAKDGKTGITYAQRKARRANRADTAKP